jgi:hypothetical protein
MSKAIDELRACAEYFGAQTSRLSDRLTAEEMLALWRAKDQHGERFIDELPEDTLQIILRSKTSFQGMGPDAVRRSGGVLVEMREQVSGDVECVLSREGATGAPIRARLVVDAPEQGTLEAPLAYDQIARSAISQADSLDSSWGDAAEWDRGTVQQDGSTLMDDQWRVTR